MTGTLETPNKPFLIGTYNILNPFHAVKWETSEGSRILVIMLPRNKHDKACRTLNDAPPIEEYCCKYNIRHGFRNCSGVSSRKKHQRMVWLQLFRC